MMPKIQQPIAATPAAADGSEYQRWNSPIPYLFGGIAMALGVLALALVILACSYRNSSSSSSEKAAGEESPPDLEPRMVVIMAGETNPTHLAKPLAAAGASRPPPLRRV
ncbi:protein GLUTAMINE DUMPER 5-like [Andrographis paniculata]|uniref:protein GLUTAMINE DUMPER 5-like n=1 Tax=Andrographis paniculata TaxID=175694 RepID=UPI0021E7A4A1|nr:protein GLUTAMINE DUMPER 5-like [Andrographis paniculata]